MRLFTAFASALFIVGVMSASANAQDTEGLKDHPMLSRMPGYVITAYEAQDFSVFDFETNPTTHVEGRYWKIEYGVAEGGKKSGPVQIGRNYTDLLVKRGGKKLVDQVDAGGGTALAWMPVAGKKIWVQVDINNNGEQYVLTVVEEAAMEQKVEFTAMELAKALGDTGSVALYGILFDTGKATIKPESAKALAPVGELLTSQASLKLEIQGHTDNVGAPAANLKLSQDRAAAVKAYLVKTFGVAADRLLPVGLGDTRPVGDNKTDDGRAKNRRVELVKK
jgi:outer membrane protein OmpA-like peptidoglycan-associated protein